ncbi:MAG: hypothetical protein IMHGJWDQ_000917 [Candidatus Fervidibacter sp.]
MQQPAGTPTAQQRASPILWRCPQCGLIFSPQPTTVRCPRCGENLRKCRYCKFADTITWECTNNRIRYTFGDELGRFKIPEPDHVWACPENLPDLPPAPWQAAMANPLTRALSWGAITAVALLILFRLFVLPAIAPPEMPESARLTGNIIAHRTEITLGEPLSLLVVVTNGERVSLDPCILVVRSELVKEADIAAQPAPLYPPERKPESVRLIFPGIPPQQTFTAWVSITPLTAQRRNYELRVEVYCGGYRAFIPRQQSSVRVRIR